MPLTTITLLTDFGYQDHYVGVMKGVILSINPQINFVDISHNVSPHNVLEGAIILRNAYSYFPRGSIHVVVVDPGVGTERKPILVSGEDYSFVGPDNGIFGLIYPQIKNFKVFELTNFRFFLSEISATFHGRDIFAPIAAYLSKGVPPAEMGQEIKNYQSISMPLPIIERKSIKGTVVHMDGFGNMLTNIDQNHLKRLGKENFLKVKIRQRIITKISQHYQNVNKGELLALIGSSGLLEIAVREGNAREIIGSKQGDEVFVFK